MWTISRRSWRSQGLILAALLIVPVFLTGLTQQDEQLFTAAKAGNVELVAQLLKQGASVAATDERGYMPLHLSAKAGSETVARLLLEKGAPVDAASKERGYTPLHLAANEAVARLLLDKGASVATTDTHQHDTALHRAAFGGWSGMAQLLVDKGASVVATNRDGVTPLHLAARGEKARLMKGQRW